MKYNKSNVRQKIMEAGLTLFLSQGYEETTISQILDMANISRSAFYNHFRSKEELLFNVAYMYDEDYDTWAEKCEDALHAVDKLILFNSFVAEILETSDYRSLYSNLYSLQVTTLVTRHIVNQERRYYQILYDILKKGQEHGEVTTRYSYIEIADMIASFQIGATYSWCLQKEAFSLVDYFNRLLTPFLESLRV